MSSFSNIINFGTHLYYTIFKFYIHFNARRKLVRLFGFVLFCFVLFCFFDISMSLFFLFRVTLFSFLYLKIWLGDLANEMKSTLSILLKDCLQASRSGNVDPTVFPSQVCLHLHTTFKFTLTFLLSM